ncbi:hypothetical protein AGMMS49942_28200 [Spirochaetia bacterium]|nr:hypothetical protein AGMMS49942_28200 [Spirochaetia bacterium]
MKKEYIYNPAVYFRKITLTAFLCIPIFIAAIALMFFDSHWQIFLLIAVVAAYTVWNTFVSSSNPGKVTLEEDGISFESYGRSTKYPFAEIKSFRAKDFRGSGKIFLRINDATFFKGRYWIHTLQCNDSEELYLYLLKLEYQTHPDSIKARAWDSTRPGVDKKPVLPWRASGPSMPSDSPTPPKIRG